MQNQATQSDLVSRFQKLQASQRDLEIQEAQAETKIQTLDEKEALILQKLKDEFGISSFDDLETSLKKETLDLESSLALAEKQLSEVA